MFHADVEIVPEVQLALVLSLCLICSTLMSAQSTGGRILGRVADSSGAVLANVKVTAHQRRHWRERDTTTSGNGEYGFPQVPVGTYRVEFDLAGFKKNVQKGVNVDLNQVVTLNSVLQIGASKEVVEVTSEAPLVDTTSTQLGAIMDARQVSNLPLNSRDTYQFLQLQPGVMSTVGSSNTLFMEATGPARFQSMAAAAGPTTSASMAETPTICSLISLPFNRRPTALRNFGFLPILSMPNTGATPARSLTW